MKRTLLQRLVLWLLKEPRKEETVASVKERNAALYLIDLSYTETYPHFTDIEHNPVYLERLSDITKQQRSAFKKNIYRYFDRHLDELIVTEVSGSQIRMSLRLYHKNPLTSELKEL